MAKRILIIEDDPDTQAGLKIRLRAAGFEAHVAVDAIIAMPMVRKTKPDLIILDLGLPGGEGFKVIDQLRASSATAPIPVVVLSARDPGVNRPKALEAGAVAFLQKPADNEELLAVINAHLGPEAKPIMRKRVLIIEDDADTQQGLGIRLKAGGYDINFASDGVTAVSMALRQKPDVIILDLELTGGDGFLVLERLKNHAGLDRVPVIVLSARDPSVNKPKALEAGAAAFLLKPADNEELLATINASLGSESKPADRKKILIVEDDPDMQQGLKIRLKANGYDTAFASDGSMAMTIAVREKPNAILLDLGLPGGDGFLVLRHLKNHPQLSSVPVIVVSARDPGVNQPKALEAGAAAFLQKPADNEELLGVIRKALGET